MTTTQDATMHFQKDCRGYLKLLLYCITMMDNIEYRQERIKDTVQEEAEEESKEQHKGKSLDIKIHVRSIGL